LDIAIFLVDLERVRSGGSRSIAEAFRRRPVDDNRSSGSMHEKV